MPVWQDKHYYACMDVQPPRLKWRQLECSLPDTVPHGVQLSELNGAGSSQT